MRREWVGGRGYKVEILGHSASGIRGIDPENPELKMGELVSAFALQKYCEREEVVESFSNWLRKGGEDPEIELALRRIGRAMVIRHPSLPFFPAPSPPPSSLFWPKNSEGIDGLPPGEKMKRTRRGQSRAPPWFFPFFSHTTPKPFEA